MTDESSMSDRPCTCHPNDNPPFPCPRKYALSECRVAAGQVPRGAHSHTPDCYAHGCQFGIPISSDHELPIDEFTVPELRMAVVLQRKEIDSLRNRLVDLEDEKNAYIDYVGDALGQDYDRETLWDAAQRVLSDRDHIRVERDALKARIAELETRSAGTWVPVTERLPPGTDDYAVRIVGREEYDYVLVLVQSVLGGKPFVAAGAYHLGEWHCNGPDVVDVTHWLDVKLPGGE